MKKEIGFIGLGKMGRPMVRRLREKGWKAASYDVNGKGSAKTVERLTASLAKPRTLFLMVPAGKPVDAALNELAPFLRRGDLVIDGGNSFYRDSMRRASSLAKQGVLYLDVGISGGPVSISQGRFAVMAGGEKKAYRLALPVFQALSDTKSVYLGPSGAGHFAKMAHNGIEYGMMQALAEGFTLLKAAPFAFKLRDVAKAYNQNSIIASRLTAWLQEGFEKYGEGLKKASGSVAHTGEGEWAVKTAKKLKLKVPVIEQAVSFRLQSAKRPSFTGKILSALRAVFGGHSIGS